MEFEEWVRPQLPTLLRLAAALSGSKHDADDLVQDVLIKTHAKWPQIQSLDHPGAYLRRMVVNEHLSWRRRLTSALRRDALTRSDLDPVAFDERWVDRMALASAVGKLPPRQRAVIVLRYLENLTITETAQTLGCTHSTVRAHTARALAGLRVSLPSDGEPTSSDRQPNPVKDQHAH